MVVDTTPIIGRDVGNEQRAANLAIRWGIIVKSSPIVGRIGTNQREIHFHCAGHKQPPTIPVIPVDNIRGGHVHIQGTKRDAEIPTVMINATPCPRSIRIGVGHILAETAQGDNRLSRTRIHNVQTPTMLSAEVGGDIGVDE